MADYIPKKSFIPRVGRRNKTDDYPRLRLGIYEGLVIREEDSWSQYSGRPNKKVQVRLDNGRKLWAGIHPKRLTYTFLGQRVTVQYLQVKEYRGEEYTRPYVYLGKWDDFGAY